jgi:sugar/nucleoside kinase (ribokinase family)
MGMNYYAVKKKPSLYNKPLHIGKSSAGWKFAFQGYTSADFNEKYGFIIKSKEGWEKLLKSGDYVILNEEDVEVSFEDLFKLIEDKQSIENPDNFKYSVNVCGYRFYFSEFS